MSQIPRTTKLRSLRYRPKNKLDGLIDFIVPCVLNLPNFKISWKITLTDCVCRVLAFWTATEKCSQFGPNFSRAGCNCTKFKKQLSNPMWVCKCTVSRFMFSAIFMALFSISHSNEGTRFYYQVGSGYYELSSFKKSAKLLFVTPVLRIPSRISSHGESRWFSAFIQQLPQNCDLDFWFDVLRQNEMQSRKLH